MSDEKKPDTKDTGKPHPVDLLYGSLKFERTTDDLIDEMRGPRPSSSSGVPRKE